MSIPYKKILIIGATSGIGEALAARFVNEGSFVIVTGRRQARLNAFVALHGPSQAASIAFDMTEMSAIPSIAAKITAEHPDLDAVLINAAIQRRYDWTHPESIDLGTIQEEFNTNFLAPMALSKAFLPHLLARGEKGLPAALMYTTSNLGLVPIPPMPNYCATKAAMHSFILTLRANLVQAKAGIKIVEILPPLVQTEIHPAVEGGQSGIPVEEFTEDCWKALTENRDEVYVGTARDRWAQFEEQRQAAFGSILERFWGVDPLKDTGVLRDPMQS